ncbi:hypothetical protein BDA96_08G201200 [Sorghum bicolor]|uniref:Uncharacterized protein n=1 Tax=Sorghum bicolor TaxID=4558 RepID=A0A921QJZ8_SORBI|nr:hypothetical protein BDA96_08G201200 [Sorghum bicolor]
MGIIVMYDGCMIEGCERGDKLKKIKKSSSYQAWTLFTDANHNLLDYFLGAQDRDCHLNFIKGGKKIVQLQVLQGKKIP